MSLEAIVILFERADVALIPSLSLDQLSELYEALTSGVERLEFGDNDLYSR